MQTAAHASILVQDKRLNDYETETLWLGAFRYYCGRMTYAVDDFCNLLCKEWQNLPERTQILIHAELENTFEQDDKYRPDDHYAPLGADCDRQSWEKVRAIWATSNADLRGRPLADGPA